MDFNLNILREFENPLIKEVLNPMAFSRELKQFLLEDLPDSGTELDKTTFHIEQNQVNLQGGID